VQWGCTAPAKEKVEIEGQLLTRCPMRLFLDNPTGMSKIMWYYDNYKRGVLPVDGGLLDQPALLMEFIVVIQGAVNTIQSAEDEEQKRKMRAAENKGRRGGNRRSAR